MKKIRLLFFAVLLIFFCGCGKQDTAEDAVSDNEIQVDEDNNTADAGSAADSADAALIDSLLDTKPEAETSSNKRIITVQRITTDVPAAGTVSSAPSTYTADDDDTDDNDLDDDDETTTGFGTPVTFDVDECMIEVDGTYDTKLSGEILTALNNARTQEGLDAFDTNASLSKVADVRAKEITYSISHQRANGSYWSTVAPEHFEAECLAVDYTDAVTTVNAWLSDEGTRQYLLCDDLDSIGVSCFKYADKYYIAAALGS